MLTIASGVVLGGIVLYILYGFREEIAKALAWPFWGAIGIGIVALCLTSCVGAYRLAERALHHTAEKPTIPEGIFAWVVLLTIVYFALKP